MTTEVALIGTGGLTVIGAGEAAVRTRFEGMTTDPSRNIHLYGIDLDPPPAPRRTGLGHHRRRPGRTRRRRQGPLALPAPLRSVRDHRGQA